MENTKDPQPIDALRRAHWLLYSEGNEDFAEQIAILIRSYGFEVKPQAVTDV